ncbi:hypothetical protein ACJMK2_020633 [Sinanodonta woodiana]|uniref:Calpain catalytic domain-containing protein n=1 Tax=Sinanodonta woodiana TaxID=1069815 RepID=A0ABD3U341_SINWO
MIYFAFTQELSKKPTFTADGYSKLDVIPGWLGETSLCSAFSCLTLAPNLVARCIPDGQEFDNKYSGIFHFKFWRFGEWIEVIIDDRLPVCSGQPMFSRGKDSNEFWIPLFEKAYAK